ncbi:MAG: hypothetical protein JRI70_03470 [Deltaproteobacteria bacterium]|nr:hypothetical protein [Deltaproteobacteria bacterium]
MNSDLNSSVPQNGAYLYINGSAACQLRTNRMIDGKIIIKTLSSRHRHLNKNRSLLVFQYND